MYDFIFIGKQSNTDRPFEILQRYSVAKNDDDNAR